MNRTIRRGFWIGIVFQIGNLFGQVPPTIAPRPSFPDADSYPDLTVRYPDPFGRVMSGRPPLNGTRGGLEDAELDAAAPRINFNPAVGGSRWTVSAYELRHPLSKKGRELLDNARKSSRQNDHEKAIAILNQALNDPGAAIYAHALLGAEYLRVDRLTDAIPHLKTARDQFPRSAGTRSNLGFALCLSGEYGDGKHEIEEALRLDRELPQAHFLLGLIKLHESEIDQSVDHLRRAAGMNLPSARLMLAAVYLRDGDQDASEKELLAYREKNPRRDPEELRMWVAAASKSRDLTYIGFHLGCQD